MDKIKQAINKALPFILIFCAFSIATIIFNSFSYFEDKDEMQYYKLSNQWSVHDESGNLIFDDIDLSYEVNASMPEELYFSTILNENYYDDNLMELCVYQMSFVVYLENQVIYEHIFEGNTLNPNNPGSAYYVMNLPDNIEGKLLTIKYIRNNPGISIFVQAPTIINARSFSKDLNAYEIVTFSIMNAFIFLGIILIICYFALKKAFKSPSFIVLGLLFISLGIWVLTYDKIIEIYFKNPVLSHDLEYLSLYIIPFSVWAYIYYSWEKKSNLVYIFMLANGLFYVTILFLKLVFKLDYSLFLKPFHIFVLVNMVACLYVLIKGLYKNSNSYKLFIIGAFVFVTSPIIALVQQYFRLFDNIVYYLFTFQIILGGILIALSIIFKLIESIRSLHLSSSIKNQKAEIERTEQILCQSGNILMNWNFVTDEIYYSNGFQEYFGIDIPHHKFSQSIINSKIQSCGDISFIDAINMLKGDIDELHLICCFDTDDETKYCKMDFSTYYDLDDVKTNIIVLIQDITELKQLEKNQEIQKEISEINSQLYDHIIEIDITNNQIKVIKANTNLKSYIEKHDLSYDETIQFMLRDLIHEEYKITFLNNLSRIKLVENYKHNVRRYEFETYEKIDNNEYQWFNIMVNIHRSNFNDNLKAIIYAKNITEQKNQLITLQKQSQIDFLTDLYNKETFKRKVRKVINNSNKEEHHALLIFDIDDFKIINDSLGHQMGDAVIKDVGQRLKGFFRSTDIVGRFGGDEFVVLLKDFDDEIHLRLKCLELSEYISYTFIKDDISIDIKMSFGVSLFPNDGTTYDELFDKADNALYDAKDNGKNTFKIYNL